MTCPHCSNEFELQGSRSGRCMKCGIEIFVTLEGEVRGVAGTEYPVRPDMSAIYNDFVASGSSEDYEEEVPD